MYGRGLDSSSSGWGPVARDLVNLRVSQKAGNVFSGGATNGF